VKEKDHKYPDPNTEAAKCLSFLEKFEDKDTGVLKYMDLLQRVVNREQRVVQIELDDVEEFEQDSQFVENILRNTRRYVTLFARCIDQLIKGMAPTVHLVSRDVVDILIEQRLSTAGDDEKALEQFPPELLRRYELHFKPLSTAKALPLREIRARHVGSLVTVKGIVTRMSDVRPLMRVATYVCDVCGYEIYQEVDSKEYMPLIECESAVCKANRTTKSGKVYAQIRGSKFVKYQDLKLQELPGEVPVGHVPRSLSVTVRGELTRQCVPGDIVTMTGIFLVVRHQGFRAFHAGLTADTYLEVTHLAQQKKTYTDLAFSEELVARVEQSAKDGDIYTKLSKSIAPEIFGLDDVKKALLLLLVGGQTNVMKDGMRIRGDINILLLGDPGVAKSQLLKHIASIAPRGIYTTGKGSSGVGLTAAVVRDPLSGEITLEGGALVLADMGVCCIDEFDKMEEGDRTAIHEVMEQQTVSIAKAGITTTLNARASVLAAANPVYGRYNPRKSPEENIGLPTALLSRFDLTFILRDVPDADTDANLARHVTFVHRTQHHPPLAFEPFDSAFLRAYVSRARSYHPFIPKELTDHIVGTYVEMRRENDKDDERRTRFCTARSLLSILRLSQALARLRFANEVDEADVQEAVRLLFVTKAQVQDSDDRPVGKTGKGGKAIGSSDATSAIFAVIKSMVSAEKNGVVKLSSLQKRVLGHGYTAQQLRDCIAEYERLDILQVGAGMATLWLRPA